jgi:hypothetical protein
MRAIIAGGRKLEDERVFLAALGSCDWIDAIDVVLSGACGLDKSIGMQMPPYAAGVDGLGERWARERGLQVERYFADWHRSGRYDAAEGPRRNRRMAENAHALIAIPGYGASRGTNNMIQEATKHGLHVFVYTEHLK